MSNEPTDPDETVGTAEGVSNPNDRQTDAEADGDESDPAVDEGDAPHTAVDDALEGEPFDGVVEEIPQPPEGAAGSLEISTDRLFEVLASPGNRFVLTYLLRVENPASRDSLIEYVVERADPPDGLSEGKFRGRVASLLVHSTLPQLVDAGLVEVDDDEGTVTATGAIDTVAPYLALAIAQSPSRSD